MYLLVVHNAMLVMVELHTEREEGLGLSWLYHRTLSLILTDDGDGGIGGSLGASGVPSSQLIPHSNGSCNTEPQGDLG